ncbi:MAG TPA: SpvB/TcaC N-terminal domain-containing protein, partial [Polyangiaceae bacterium]
MSASDENMRELSGAVPKQGSAQTTSESGSEASSSDGASTSFGLPSLSAPKGGGAVRGIGEKFSANAASGTASLSVPIATSPGRAGFNLGLEIHYDSGTGNGPFGEGWRLNLSAISRKTDKGVPSYVDDDESDVFVLADTEDLVRVRDGERTVGEFLVVRYRPRVEGGFARIERWSQRQTGDSHWRVTTGDNVTTVYGRSARARIADPDDRRRVFSWLIEEVRDDRGQVVRYTYKAEDGEGVLATTASEASRF